MNATTQLRIIQPIRFKPLKFRGLQIGICTKLPPPLDREPDSPPPLDREPDSPPPLDREPDSPPPLDRESSAETKYARHYVLLLTCDSYNLIGSTGTAFLFLSCRSNSHRPAAAGGTRGSGVTRTAAEPRSGAADRYRAPVRTARRTPAWYCLAR